MLKIVPEMNECIKAIDENRAQLRQVFYDYSLIWEYLCEEQNVRMVIEGDLGLKDATGLRGVIRCLCQKNKEMNSKYSQIKTEVTQWFNLNQNIMDFGQSKLVDLEVSWKKLRTIIMVRWVLFYITQWIDEVLHCFGEQTQPDIEFFCELMRNLCKAMDKGHDAMCSHVLTPFYNMTKPLFRLAPDVKNQPSSHTYDVQQLVARMLVNLQNKFTDFRKDLTRSSEYFAVTRVEFFQTFENYAKCLQRYNQNSCQKCVNYNFSDWYESIKEQLSRIL